MPDFIASHVLDVHWFLIDCAELVDDGIPYHNTKSGFSCLFSTSTVLSVTAGRNPDISSKCPSFLLHMTVCSFVFTGQHY